MEIFFVQNSLLKQTELHHFKRSPQSNYTWYSVWWPRESRDERHKIRNELLFRTELTQLNKLVQLGWTWQKEVAKICSIKLTLSDSNLLYEMMSIIWLYYSTKSILWTHQIYKLQNRSLFNRETWLLASFKI